MLFISCCERVCSKTYPTDLQPPFLTLSRIYPCFTNSPVKPPAVWNGLDVWHPAVSSGLRRRALPKVAAAGLEKLQWTSPCSLGSLTSQHTVIPTVTDAEQTQDKTIHYLTAHNLSYTITIHLNILPTISSTNIFKHSFPRWVKKIFFLSGVYNTSTKWFSSGCLYT